MEKELLPHQQRVVDEFKEVKEMTSDQSAFILDNPMFLEKSKEEQLEFEKQYNETCVHCDQLEQQINQF